MKICMITWSYWPGLEGGAERQCRKVVKNLARKGVESVVLTSLSSFKFNRRSEDGETIVLRYGWLCPLAEWLRRLMLRLVTAKGGRFETGLRALLFWLMLPFEWLARLSFIIDILLFFPRNNDGIDLIHVHETAWLAGFGGYLGKKNGIPVYCKVRNTPALDVIGYDTPFRSFWSRMRTETSFIALNPYLKEELIVAGIPEKRISIIPNGVDLPDLSAKEGQPGTVLYVGNFSQGASHKGFDVLLKGWSEIGKVNPEAHLILVGGGDYNGWLARAKIYGCENSLTFTGSVEDPARYYQQASVFLLPSRHEGMSNALLEAQSWGLACVVSDIPANLAVVDDGVNGITFQVGNSCKLAEMTTKILSDEKLKIQLGENARHKAEMDFDIEKIVDQLISLYMLAIEKKDFA